MQFQIPGCGEVVWPWCVLARCWYVPDVRPIFRPATRNIGICRPKKSRKGRIQAGRFPVRRILLMKAGVNNQMCRNHLHESDTNHTCSTSVVRRRRDLFWRPGHRLRRAWPDSGDLPHHLSRGQIIRHEKLTVGANDAQKRLHKSGGNFKVLAHGHRTRRKIIDGLTRARSLGLRPSASVCGVCRKSKSQETARSL